MAYDRATFATVLSWLMIPVSCTVTNSQHDSTNHHAFLHPTSVSYHQSPNSSAAVTTFPQDIAAFNDSLVGEEVHLTPSQLRACFDRRATLTATVRRLRLHFVDKANASSLQAGNEELLVCTLFFPCVQVFGYRARHRLKLLEQTCIQSSYVEVRSWRSVVNWTGCDSELYPLTQYLSYPDRSVEVKLVYLPSGRPYRLALEAMVERNTDDWTKMSAEVRFESAYTGVLQTPWFTLKKEPNHYRIAPVLRAPADHVILVTFTQKDTAIDYKTFHLSGANYWLCEKVRFFAGVEEPPGNAEGDGDSIPCGSVPYPPKVYRTSRLLVYYRVHLYEDAEPRKGFNLRFSFFESSKAPEQTSSGKWNCTKTTWPLLSLHFRCNLVTDCVTNADEDDCAAWTSCPSGHGIMISDICYEVMNVFKELSHRQAKVVCQREANFMVSLNSVHEWLSVTSAVRSMNVVLAIRFGLQRSADHLPFMYRQMLQWDDATMCYLPVYPFRLFSDDLCGTIDPGILMEDNHISLQRCDSRFNSYILCEKINPVKETRQTPRHSLQTIQLKAASNSSKVKAALTCPDQSFAHEFLVCDHQTSCFFEGNDWFSQEGDIWDIPTRDGCKAPMAMLPPSFACKTGQQRVPYTLVCDFRSDCIDSSDEDFCVHLSCMSGVELQCANGKECFPKRGLCDKQSDCYDDSDEASCEHQMDFGVSVLLTKYSIMPPALMDFDGSGGFTVKPLDRTLPKGDCSPHDDTHFQCDVDRYCLPVFVRCNDVKDCAEGEDEAQCPSLLCPGYYRCRGVRICLHPTHLCDGWSQCPQRDDELFCDILCPPGCSCFGLAFFCQERFSAHRFRSLRYLEGDGTGMSLLDLTHNTLLVHVSLSRCKLVRLHNVTLPNLHSLDLSHNLLKTIHRQGFSVSLVLRTLSLKNNPLVSFWSDERGQSLDTLRNLDVSQIPRLELDTEIFLSFPSLQRINLSSCGLMSIEGDGFQRLASLQTVDLRGNPLEWFTKVFMQGATSLHYLYADNYKLCCPELLPEDFNSNNCLAPYDEVSSCQALLRSDVYRAFLSVFAVLSIMGNLASFVMRAFIEKEKRGGFQMFVTHLCMSDFLMGLYLAIIGVADMLYRDSYVWEDTLWRRSVTCHLAGFLSLLSCEVSVFCVLIITLDRFLALRFPFSHLRFTVTSAQCACALIWMAGVTLAGIPLLPVTSSWEFYSQTGICVPLPVTRRHQFAGHSYCFGLLIVLNFVLFLLIAGGQASIYLTVRNTSLTVTSASVSRPSRDTRIARRLLTVVATDFLCWFPIGTLGLLAARGTSVPGEVNVAMAIFVLPVNAALNPFLYTLNWYAERRRRQGEEQLLKRLTQVVKNQLAEQMGT